MKLLFIFSIILVLPSQAFAYVGPGLGLGAIGAVLGIIFSIFLALLGIFWYPIKRLIKKFRTRKKIE